MKKYILILSLVILLFAVSAESAFAVQWWPILPCGYEGKPECQRCDLLKLLKNLIDFVYMGLVPVAGGILFSMGGFYILMGGANPTYLSKGKDLFKNTVYGVVVISLAWLITNTLVVNLGQASGGESTAPWYKLQCVNPVDRPPSTGTGGGGTGATGSVPQQVFVSFFDACKTPKIDRTELCAKSDSQLASLCGVPATRTNSPALQSMVNCILQDKEVQQLAITKQDAGLFTTDVTHARCNFVRGFSVCTACSHGGGKGLGCHYGGKTGTQGAEAVDFNAKIIANEYQLCRAISRVAKGCGAKFVNWEGNHTHVSTTQCDADGTSFDCK